MTLEIPRPVLKDKKALVVGIANEHSIAYGCAAAFRELGAQVAITYLNEKAKAYVEPLAQKLEAPIFMPLDVRSRASWRRCSNASPRTGGGWTSWCTRSPGRRRTTCRAGC